jgi:hypothetical protein
VIKIALSGFFYAFVSLFAQDQSLELIL